MNSLQKLPKHDISLNKLKREDLNEPFQPNLCMGLYCHNFLASLLLPNLQPK